MAPVRVATVLLLVVGVSRSEVDTSFAECKMDILHFVAKDPVKHHPPHWSTTAESLQKLWEFANSYSDPLNAVLIDPSGLEGKWEEKEQIALDALGVNSLCKAIEDIKDAKNRGTLYIILDRRFLPQDMEKTTFIQFVRAIFYIGISKDDDTEPLKLSRPLSHFTGAAGFKMAEKMGFPYTARTLLHERLGELLGVGGSAVLALIPNVASEEAVIDLESTVIAAYASVHGFQLSGTISDQLANVQLHKGTYYAQLELIAEAGRAKAPHGEKAAYTNEQKPNMAKSHQELGVKRIYRLHRLFVSSVAG